jgi:hypothetical protein
MGELCVPNTVRKPCALGDNVVDPPMPTSVEVTVPTGPRNVTLATSVLEELNTALRPDVFWIVNWASSVSMIWN